MNKKKYGGEFEDKFNKTNGCWEWLGAKNWHGYGIFQRKRAHRLSYEKYINNIPKGLYVCHKCDNPSCVNPDHLFLGTQKDNMADCARKNRTNNPQGTSHVFSKITEEDVKNIRRDKRRIIDIAKEYDMHCSQISRIRTGFSYKNVKRSGGV